MDSGETSLNGSQPLNSNGAPQELKCLKKEKKVATFFGAP